MADVSHHAVTAPVDFNSAAFFEPQPLALDSKDDIDVKPVNVLTPLGEEEEEEEEEDGDELDDNGTRIKMSPSDDSGTLLRTSVSHAPRRPHRKSTLTQQQKNLKRQRATQAQLETLEVEFNKNPTPTAAVREKIAQDINMTERSVQIWFQNRRAKIKNLAKKSAEIGEECEGIPESMRRYLAMQAMETGKSQPGNEYFINGGMGTFTGSLLLDTESPASKVLIHHLTCRSLSIGTWRRIGQTQLDLVVFYCPTKSMMTYYIQADSTGFRIEYPFSYIKSMTLDTGDVSANAEGASQQSASIVIELNHAPIFTMDQGSQGWYQCRDFTEDQQASHILTHHLGGHAKVLSSQMAKLVSLDTYRMRHSAFDTSAIASSAPVSPTIAHRPASQPNHLVHPHSGMFHQGAAAFNMAPPPPRGHKRQRSRSVPVAIDFSQRHQPLPDFMIHHQHQHHHVHHHGAMQNRQNNQPHQPLQTHQAHQNHIFAPVPQHAVPLPYHHSPPMFGGMNMALNIDTTTSFRFDFVPPGPPSATTATTPPSSEFEASVYGPRGPGSEALSAPQVHTPYNGPFLSPLVDSSSQHHPSVSPLSAMGHQDNHVLNGHPAYGLYRSVSADPAAFQNENNKISNFDIDVMAGRERPAVYDADALFEEKNALDALLIDEPLLDPFSKQPLTLPFRMPNEEMVQPQALSQPATEFPVHPTSSVEDDFEFHHLVHLDPSMSPEEEKPTFLT